MGDTLNLREGETVGQYIVRLEHRLAELEPPKEFTVQEWHIGQVYCFVLWRGDGVRSGDADAIKKWGDLVIMYEDRFPEVIAKFKAYMGWE